MGEGLGVLLKWGVCDILLVGVDCYPLPRFVFCYLFGMYAMCLLALGLFFLVPWIFIHRISLTYVMILLKELELVPQLIDSFPHKPWAATGKIWNAKYVFICVFRFGCLWSGVVCLHWCDLPVVYEKCVYGLVHSSFDLWCVVFVGKGLGTEH